MGLLIPPVPQTSLPLSLDDDLTVCFQQVSSVDGVTPVVFAVGTVVSLVIDAVPQISVAATISGSSANVYVAASSVNSVAAGTLWRLLMSFVPQGGGAVVTKCAVNGRVVRYDG